MSSTRTILIVVGKDAFPVEQFSKLLEKLTEKFTVIYLPNMESCLSHVRQKSDLSDSIFRDSVSDCQLFLFSDFDNPTALQSLTHLLRKARFLGYPAFMDITLSQRAWLKPRPVFNFSMSGAVVCITGYRDKQIVNELASMINWMAGSVQRSLNLHTTTHLVAYRCAGEKVRAAALSNRRIATVRASWIRAAWARRTERPTLKAADPDFVSTHRAKLFQETCLAFVGFTPGSEELNELCNLVVDYDGQVTSDLNDSRLTHVIVTDAWPGYGNILDQLKCLLVSEPSMKRKSTTDRSRIPSGDTSSINDEDHYRISLLGSIYRVPVVRLEWFWLSVQLTCMCQLEHYLYVAGPTRSTSTQLPQLPPLAKPSVEISHPTVPSSPILTRPTIDEPIREEEEEDDDNDDRSMEGPTPSSPTGDHSLSDLLTPIRREGADKENQCPKLEFHSFDSNPPTSPNSTTHSKDRFKFFAKSHSSSAEKISFVTSPRHRNSPRGFVSPSSMDVSNGSGSFTRGKTSTVRTNCSSSQDDLLTHLADPLSIPSNQERRMCQLGLTPEFNKVTYISPVSFNSGALLNATNTSDQNQTTPNTALSMTEQKNQGFNSLMTSLREVLNGSGVSNSDCTINTALTVRSPNLVHSMSGEELTQTSTPSSGKRKSSQRLSLLHSTVRKSRTPASELSVNLSEHSKPSESPSGTPTQVRLEKRQHRVFEFFVTERNYLEILRYLHRVAYPQVVDEDQSGGPLLPRQEADYVFGRLGPIYELHERLRPKLNELEANWSNHDSLLGCVLNSNLLEEMDKAYEKYMQFYSPPYMHHLGEQYPRFLAFMRQVERRKESGRQSLAALLVRPVQRLPSIALLMEGISKFTPPSHADHVAITQFAKNLNELLTSINDRLRKNEERLSLLSLYHEIIGAPPEILSSSRSLVARLNVFELGTSASGNTTCEPVTLFLLTDCLEIARPRKRHTGEPLAHAIHAAVAAIHGETDGADRTQVGDQSQPTSAAMSTNPSTGSAVTVTRTGSGASGASLMNMGLMEGKQRCNYKHLYLLKLNEIKRVVNFDTASPDRAAFGLVVRSNSEIDDRVHAYCLAASFTASAAVAAGRCPEPVESAVLAVRQQQHQQQSVHMDTRSAATDTNPDHVSMLQSCVDEAKRSFLNRLCHHIIQVSCLVNSPDELLVDVLPEELLGFDLEQVFNAMAHKSKKFSRQLTRNISIKTPRRPVASALKAHNSTLSSQTPQSNMQSEAIPMSSPRRSVLGNLIGHRGSNPFNTEPCFSTDDLLVDSSASPSQPDQFASTPLQSRKKCASLRPPQTPTADLVANAMLSLFRTPHTRTDQTSSTTCSLYEDYTDDYPDADTSSIASSILDTGFWPSCGGVGQHMKRVTSEALQSSTSIRSTQLDHGVNHADRGQKCRHSVSSRRDTLFGPNPVFYPDRSVQGERKSVCHSVLAGLKNFRRSIAGAGSALVHGSASTSSFSSTLGRRNQLPFDRVSAATPSLNSPMNRSASVDAGICATTLLTATNSPFIDKDRRSTMARNVDVSTPPPTPTSSPYASVRCRRQPPVTKHNTTQLALTTEENRMFPRSLTASNIGTVGQSIPSLQQYGRTLTALDVNMENVDDQPICVQHDLSDYAERVGGSVISLLDWDSRSMVDIPEVEPNGQSVYKNRTSNAMTWETVSHMGVSTGEDVRRSFRLPSSRPLSKRLGTGAGVGIKKSSKNRFGAFGYLFQKSSSQTKPAVESSLASGVEPTNHKSHPSRRESLLRAFLPR